MSRPADEPAGSSPTGRLTAASDAAAASVRLTREPSERFHLCLLIMKPMAPQSVITTPSKPRRPRSSSGSRRLAQSGVPLTELYAHMMPRTRASPTTASKAGRYVCSRSARETLAS